MFTAQTFKFLKELERNNTREWFALNKSRYEDVVRTPAFDYIESIATPLAKISPHFIASAKKTGGSLMRVHRDIRFSKDKTPYKTNIGIHFRHSAGRDVHAPGFYLHIEPGECFLAAGIYSPDNPTLSKVRTLIDEYPNEWISIRDKLVNNQSGFAWHGDSLKRPPRGYDASHPLLDDLKRKHFIAVKPLSQKAITTKTLVKDSTRLFATTAALLGFICDACDLPF